MKTVLVLLSGKKLDKNAFFKYFIKKISKTAKQLHLKEKTKPEKIYCLDDAVIEIIYGLMIDKKPIIKKSAFLYCLKKEIELFARLKGIKFNFYEYSGLKLEISKMLDELEKKHPEIKYSIINANKQIK